MIKEIYWLLKDKYNFSDFQINEFNETKVTDLNIKRDLERIKNSEPINYIIGWQNFLDCKIDLSLKPLIPRVETEYWVNEAIQTINNQQELKILDLCCGSGCIGIAILKHILYSTVTFSDISTNAISQTKINLEINQIPANKYKIIESNLFDNINEKFDYIFTNPPYVSKNDVIPDSLKFEPELALFADNNGMEAIENILENFDKFLKPNGHLYLEFGVNQTDKIKEILTTKNFMDFEFIQDQYKIDRVLHYRLM